MKAKGVAQVGQNLKAGFMELPFSYLNNSFLSTPYMA
jgi:hypothetical protein